MEVRIQGDCSDAEAIQSLLQWNTPYDSRQYVEYARF